MTYIVIEAVTVGENFWGPFATEELAWKFAVWQREATGHPTRMRPVHPILVTTRPASA